MNKYIVIGDSHSGYFTNDGILAGNVSCVYDNFYVYCIGAYTAYGLLRVEKIKQIITILDKHPDVKNLIFSFGEIDIRCHIHKRLDKIDYVSNIKNIVDRYYLFLRMFMNYEVYVMLPIMPQYEFIENENITGTLKERQICCELFCYMLREKCKYNNIHFIELTTTPELFVADKIHLKKEVYSQIQNYNLK